MIFTRLLPAGSRAVLLLTVVLAWPAIAGAQTMPSPEEVKAPIPRPPLDTASVSPASMVTRDEQGHITLRTTRVASPIVVDGRLDEPDYQRISAASAFVQQDPAEGEPATDRTEVWVFYDDKNIYVGARLWETVPDRRVTSDMRRDSPNLYNNDHFAVLVDTFNDRRNGFGFMANAQGGLFDWAVTNEQPNNNWNQIWISQAAEFEGGWSVEFQIPFRSLRISADSAEWGINFRRMVRWKNEISYLSGVPRSWGRRGLSKVSSAATLVGLEQPARTINLDLKPYLLGSTLTNRRMSPALNNDGDAQWGVDAKWGITQSIFADFTYNTDFAQVEDDEQQVNLTRFSLFFPERREFFLEGQDVFSFGGTGGGGAGFAGPGGFGGGGFFNNQNTPILFFSRRIGLDSGQVVPIVAGGRVLGRSGAYNLGALTMRTDDVAMSGQPQTQFSVARLTRDVFARGRIGVIGTARNPAGAAAALTSGYTAGADGVFNLYDNVNITTYYARTSTAGRTGDESSYRGAYLLNGDRWGFQGDYLHVGADFNPQVGFMRRQAFDRSFGQLRFSTRPGQPSFIRRQSYEVNYEYLTGPRRALESREAQGSYRMELNNGDQLGAEATRTFESLLDTFLVGRDVTIPVGAYSFTQVRTYYSFGNQRRINGGLMLNVGGFYDGTIKEIGWRGRIEPSSIFQIEPTLSWNQVTTPRGDFTTLLAINRLTWTMSPRRFVSALVQYQSATNSITTNARFRWEYAAGSELFVVYSDGRTTLDRGFPQLDNRSLVVKATRLFRW